MSDNRFLKCIQGKLKTLNKLFDFKLMFLITVELLLIGMSWFYRVKIITVLFFGMKAIFFKEN